METTIVYGGIFGLYRDHGKEDGHYRDYRVEWTVQQRSP